MNATVDVPVWLALGRALDRLGDLVHAYTYRGRHRQVRGYLGAVGAQLLITLVEDGRR